MRSDEVDRDTAHMRPELEALRRDAVADPTAVDRFVDGRSFPLIDDGTSTFVYRGEADSVSPAPLGVRPRRHADVHPPRRHRPVVRRARRPARLAHRVQDRGHPWRPRGVDPGPAQPAHRPRPVRRQLGLADHGLRAAGMDAPRPRGARAAPWSPTAATARRSGARSTSTSTSRHGSVRRAATRC